MTVSTMLLGAMMILPLIPTLAYAIYKWGD